LSIRLFYNRDFPYGKELDWGDWSGSYSTLFHPDITIAVIWKGKPHWFHFDAKYRLDVKTWKESLSAGEESREEEKQTEAVGIYKNADLYKMHTYRDAILGSRGSYILYPGKQLGADAVDVYVRHSWATIPASQMPGVGAFALCPGYVNDQIGNLKQF